VSNKHMCRAGRIKEAHMLSMHYVRALKGSGEQLVLVGNRA